MNQEIFAIYDSAAKRYLEPFFSVTIEAAIRGFRKACMQEGSQFNEFPGDYTLFHLGSYEAESGLIYPLATPHSVGLAISFTTPQEVPSSE